MRFCLAPAVAIPQCVQLERTVTRNPTIGSRGASETPGFFTGNLTLHGLLDFPGNLPLKPPCLVVGARRPVLIDNDPPVVPSWHGTSTLRGKGTGQSFPTLALHPIHPIVLPIEPTNRTRSSSGLDFACQSLVLGCNLSDLCVSCYSTPS